MLRGTYHNGFAPRDGEPRFPSLWRGCRRAWTPSLGFTGGVMRDNAYRKDHVTLSFGSASWANLNGAICIDYAGTVSQSFSITDLQTPAVSVALWIARNGVQGGFWFPIGVSDVGNTGYRFWGGLWSINLFSDTALSILMPALTDRTWTHWCGTYDGSTLRAYVNGLLVNSKTPSVDIDYTSTTGALWNRSGWGAFNGALDDVRIYDRAITQQEVLLLASRRGIAYELEEQTLDPGTNRRRRVLIGA